jgi:hypothetical protein
MYGFFIFLRYNKNIDNKSTKRVFLMKGIIKIFGIIALSAVIVFSMTACPNEPSPPAEPKYFITVTGIPVTYDGMYGILLVFPPNSSDPKAYTAWSLRQKIKVEGNSYTFPLYNNAGSDPWAGSGNYFLNILIYQNSTTPTVMSSGNTTPISITDKYTTIAWGALH